MPLRLAIRVIHLIVALVLLVPINLWAATPATAADDYQQTAPGKAPVAMPAAETPADLALPAAAPTLDEPLDIVLLQDETGSMSDDISALRTLAPAIWDNMAAVSGAGFRMSVAGFRDFARGAWGSSADWVYRRAGDFTSSRQEFVAALGRLSASGGSDFPESQYAALDYLLRPDHACIDSDGDGSCADAFDTPAGLQPDFRPGARRVILIATDASFHEPGLSPGYPGPSRNRVLEALHSSGAVVIGLVPGGHGALPQLDELAAATGGTTQATGSSGAAVADAILASLRQIRMVSAERSTIVAASASGSADGATPVELTVTLRDEAGIPLSGRRVLIFSSRGSADWIAQPEAVTDGSGRAVGSVTTLYGGTALLSAVEVSENVALRQPAQVAFAGATVLPDAELRQAADLLERRTLSQLDTIQAKAQEVGVHGDYFATARFTDAISLLTGLLDFVSAGEGIDSAAAAVQPASYLAYPVLLQPTWQQVVVPFKETFPGAGRMFNDAVRSQAQAGQWPKLSLTLVKSGLLYYAASFRDSAAEEMTEEAVVAALEELGELADGMRRRAASLAGDIPALKQVVAEQRAALDGGVATMTPALQQAYANDLRRRAQAAIVYESAITRQEIMLNSLHGAHETTNKEVLLTFILKFGGSTLATAVFDGFGKFLFEGTYASINTYLNAKKLDGSTRGYLLADGVLKGAVDSARQAMGNAAGGMLRARTNAGVNTAQGDIRDIRLVSEGVGAGVAWWEENSYADVTVDNPTGADASYNLVTEYGYDNTLFGFLTWAYLPMVKTEVVQVPPYGTNTVRVYFKRGAQDGSPRADSNLSFALIGINETGFFQADLAAASWRPERSRLGAKGAAVSAAEAAAPAYATPLDVYVIGDPATQTYEALLMVSNPLTSTVRTEVTQELPAAATLLETDGAATGATITWQSEVLPGDIVQLRVRFRYPLSGEEVLRLPAARIKLVDEATGTPALLSAPPAEFAPLWPLAARLNVPSPRFGEPVQAMVRLTNQGPSHVTGVLQLRVVAAGLVVAHRSVPVGLAPGAERVDALALPADLSPGVYAVEVWSEVGGVERRIAASVLVVQGSSVALPRVGR